MNEFIQLVLYKAHWMQSYGFTAKRGGKMTNSHNCNLRLVKGTGSWLLTLFLVVIFMSSGLHKIMPSPSVVESFQCWGYPDWFRVTLGIAEIGASALLLIPSRASYAASFLATLMLGAIATHLRWQEYSGSVAPILLGAFCVVLMFVRRAPKMLTQIL
jgi:putative oxidoreductase